MSSAVKSVTDTVFGHEDDSSQKAQIRQNQQAKDLIERNSIQARADALDLFPTSDINRNRGLQAAFNVIGSTIPQQFDTIRQGNVGAQQALLAGLPQIQNAIMGNKVDLSGLMPESISVDTSFAQQQVPNFRLPVATRESETATRESDAQRMAQAAQQQAVKDAKLGAIVNNDDLFRAAISGDIAGLSNSDRDLWERHLGIHKDDKFTGLVNDPSRREFMKRPGGSEGTKNALVRLLTQFEAQRPA